MFTCLSPRTNCSDSRYMWCRGNILRDPVFKWSGSMDTYLFAPKCKPKVHLFELLEVDFFRLKTNGAWTIRNPLIGLNNWCRQWHQLNSCCIRLWPTGLTSQWKTNQHQVLLVYAYLSIIQYDETSYGKPDFARVIFNPAYSCTTTTSKVVRKDHNENEFEGISLRQIQLSRSTERT